MFKTLKIYSPQFLGNWGHAKSRSVIPALAGVHVADRSCQEASDRLRFEQSLHIVYSFITLGLLTACSSIQTDSTHHLTLLFTPLAFGWPFLQSRPAEPCIISQEQETQCSRGFVQTMHEPWVNLNHV